MVDQIILETVESLCNRLTERRVVLFLGAGINWGLAKDDGVDFPLGQNLADMISKDLLESDSTGRPLDEAAEMARFRVGNKAVNEYIHKVFSGYSPGPAHLAIAQLPWNAVYTTNYDTLVETASQNTAIVPAGQFKPIFSLSTSLEDFSEDDILYYKLHGCIDYANTDEGRLILTKEDYRYYDRHRKSLFRRLKEDLLSQTFLFIGYRFADSNFRAILEDCREELGAGGFPQSYAIRVGADPSEQTFWQEKYNLFTLNIDGSEFLNLVKGTWNAQSLSVVPFDERDRRNYIQTDSTATLPKIGDCFYRLDVDRCTGVSKPAEFFLGAEPTWADIRDEVAPLRDEYDSIFNAALEELVDTSQSGNVYLITGHAGTGKSTLLRSFAFELARDTECLILFHVPGTPLDHRELQLLHNESSPKRIVVFIEHAADCCRDLGKFVQDVRRAKVPVTIFLEERKNQWESVLNRRAGNLNISEFELGRLSRREIDVILDALEKHGALGKLTGTSRDYQVDHFSELADKELLVALRELTSDSKFDDIVRDEYQKIPSTGAKRAYIYVAALGQLDLPVRFEVLSRLVDIPPQDLGKEVLAPAEGILLSLEDFGRSRHHCGFRLKARHPIIASIVFDDSAPNDDAKFEIINEIVEQLDPGFPEDKRVLESIVQRKELVNTLASPAKRRAVFEKLESVLPDDPYVLQHRSILERDIGDPDEAIRYAKAALKTRGNNIAFKNTLGHAYEAKARNSSKIERDALLSEATKIFEEGMKRQPTDPFGYLGMIQVLRQKERNETDSTKKTLLAAEILSFVEEGFDRTGESSLLAGELAKERANFGGDDKAVGILNDALKNKPSDSRLRDLLIRLELKRGNPTEAKKVAEQGVKYDPTNWRLQRQMAKIQETLGESQESIIGHYEAAIRHQKGDPVLTTELGAFLTKKGLLPQANAVFSTGRDLLVSAPERRKIREFWIEGGKRRLFKGKVDRIAGAIGFVIAMPENFHASFWRSHKSLASLQMGDLVEFNVAFCAQGPVAWDIHKAR